MIKEAAQASAENRGDVKRAGARPQNDQHADQSDRGCQPAPHTHNFTQKNDR
jgi:hypothetical protein